MGFKAQQWINGLTAAVSPAERRAVILSFGYFFCLLAAYFLLRPLRDEMGIAAGRDVLQYLFTATFVAMLVAAPLYALLAARLTRRRFIAVIYSLFIVNLIGFWALLTSGAPVVATARVFFVWVSVFNLFAVSVFWTYMADLFRPDQGKRLFGIIAAGGTGGTLLGSGLAVVLPPIVGVPGLLLVAAGLLGVALVGALALEGGEEARSRGAAVGGSMLEGFALLLRSPFLIGIGVWVLLLSLAGTFLYFLQQDVVRALSTDPAVRTRAFAAMDLAANLLTLLLQFIATGALMRRLGLGLTAALLPLIFAGGFAALALAPTLATVIAFQALQRTGNFAFANPAREVWFTGLTREEKYKAKNLIDTVLFRGGDVLWSWVFALLKPLFGGAGLVVLAIPVMIGWAGLSFWLGKRQERATMVANTQEEPPP